MTSIEPSPRYSALDMANRGSLYAVNIGQLALEHNASHRSNDPYVHLAQFAVGVTRPAQRRAMHDRVVYIALARLPRQMVAGTTRQVTIAATVRGLMIGKWRGTVDLFADNTGNDRHPAAVPYFTNAVSVSSERPKQAFFGSVLDGQFIDKPLRLTPCRSAARWRTMALPSAPMRRAPAARYCTLAAPTNRAYLGISHSNSLRSFRSGRVECFNTGAPDFYKPSSDRGQVLAKR